MADEGFLISASDYRRMAATVRAYEKDPRNRPPRTQGSYQGAGRPNLIVMLTEDLDSADEARAAVLQAEDGDTVQAVTIVGHVSGGSFTLSLDLGEDEPEETESIDWNATPAMVREALEALPSLNPGDVDVRFGKIIDDPGPPEEARYTGRWLVRFQGQFTGQDVPLLEFSSELETNGDDITRAGVTGEAIRVRLWDTKREEIVRADLPVGSPTPLKAGAIATAKWISDVGYVLDAVECREFILAGEF